MWYIKHIYARINLSKLKNDIDKNQRTAWGTKHVIKGSCTIRRGVLAEMVLVLELIGAYLCGTT